MKNEEKIEESKPKVKVNSKFNISDEIRNSVSEENSGMVAAIKPRINQKEEKEDAVFDCPIDFKKLTEVKKDLEDLKDKIDKNGNKAKSRKTSQN